MPQYTMFKADGMPVRSEVSVDGWQLQVTGAAGPGAKGLLDHELTHVVRNGSTVRAWMRRSERKVPSQNLSHTATPFYCLPEVEDEVLVSFLNATPMNVLIHFNPKEISVDRSVPWGSRASGAAKQGTFRVLVKRKGPRPLNVQIMVCPSDRFDRDVVSTKIL